MKSKLHRIIFGADEVSEEARKAHLDGQRKLKEMRNKVEEMQRSFTDGGVITFSQMENYIVSTGETPMKYNTGKHCFAYRLPCPDPDKILFYCTFEPPEGEVAEYGWHKHPDCDEEVLQLENEGEVNGEKVLPFQFVSFPAGTEHNYLMKSWGAILVTFTRVKK